MGQTPSKKHKLPAQKLRQLRPQVSLVDTEIQDWYSEFRQSSSIKEQGEVYLGEKDFVKVYSSVFPGQSDDFARHVFRTFDVNEMGRVDFPSFLIGLSMSGSSKPSKIIQWAFRCYDVNLRGYFTRADMAVIFQALYKMLGQTRLMYNGERLTSEELADCLFYCLTPAGQGRVTWPQFREGAARYPIVLNLLQCAPPDTS